MFSVSIKNAAQTNKALKEMDKIFSDSMSRELGKAAKEVSMVAKGLVDPSGPSHWGLFRKAIPYDASTIKGGIKVVRGGRRKRGHITSNYIGVGNSSAAGAIYELAGRLSKGKGQPGEQLIRSLNKRGGPASRLAWRAVDSTAGGDIQKRMVDAVKEAAQITQSIMR